MYHILKSVSTQRLSIFYSHLGHTTTSEMPHPALSLASIFVSPVEAKFLFKTAPNWKIGQFMKRMYLGVGPHKITEHFTSIV
jgi:hypothetical protein